MLSFAIKRNDPPLPRPSKRLLPQPPGRILTPWIELGLWQLSLCMGAIWVAFGSDDTPAGQVPEPRGATQERHFYGSPASGLKSGESIGIPPAG